MAYPYTFLNLDNFELAFKRVVYGRNPNYKRFYQHLITSYQLALRENLLTLIDDIRKRTYRPANSLVVYLPRPSGVLRPITILTFADLVLYQAIMNYVGLKAGPSQIRYALTKSFGAVLTEKDKPTFYRDWRVTYRAYYDAIVHAFNLGNDHFVDFDLVSFYDLIDHKLLREILGRYIDNKDILDLLFKCLDAWRKNSSGESIHHGIPQGPEPSAFLAECVLFRLDALRLRDVVYLRYIDDIKLIAKGPVPLRRALVRLDLESKELGLVPKAQQPEMARVNNVDEIIRIIPSGLLLGVSRGMMKAATQKKLLSAFKRSLVRERNGWNVRDATSFRYTLRRLKPRREILRRIKPLLLKRPDLSWILSEYLRGFQRSKEAADALLHALRENPVYDAAAMDYIEALDVCEPAVGQAPYRRVIHTAMRRSEEKSALVKLARLTFRGKRVGIKDALQLIQEEPHPMVRGIVIHRLFVGDSAPYKLAQCRDLLEVQLADDDPDLARYCAALLLQDWPATTSWATKRNSNDAVKILTKAIGLRRKGPRRPGIISMFFSRRLKINIPFPWKRALGREWRDAERRCLRFQELEVGDPDPKILILDTLNEVLIQSFSKKHPQVSAAYRAAAGGRPQPNFGAWLGNSTLKGALPRRIGWFRWVHAIRVGAELAHARHHGGPRRGLPTRPVSRKTAEKVMRAAPLAYAELITEWKKVL